MNENRSAAMQYIVLLTMVFTSASISASDFDETNAAAKLGDTEAQFSLGVMYASGEGVLENKLSAYLWWSMAKMQGDKDAAGNLDMLKPRMTEQQISEAQALAAKCYESDYKDCD